MRQIIPKTVLQIIVKAIAPPLPRPILAPDNALCLAPEIG